MISIIFAYYVYYFVTIALMINILSMNLYNALTHCHTLSSIKVKYEQQL